jgi:hypothetical protein
MKAAGGLAGNRVQVAITLDKPERLESRATRDCQRSKIRPDMETVCCGDRLGSWMQRREAFA